MLNLRFTFQFPSINPLIKRSHVLDLKYKAKIGCYHSVVLVIGLTLTT